MVHLQLAYTFLCMLQVPLQESYHNSQESNQITAIHRNYLLNNTHGFEFLTTKKSSEMILKKTDLCLHSCGQTTSVSSKTLYLLLYYNSNIFLKSHWHNVSLKTKQFSYNLHEADSFLQPHHFCAWLCSVPQVLITNYTKHVYILQYNRGSVWVLKRLTAAVGSTLYICLKKE